MRTTSAAEAAPNPTPVNELSLRARAVAGSAIIREGRVHIDTPRLADNGHSVPVVVNVDSAMSTSEYVRRIVLISESNPRPLIATFHLSPKNGRAEITTRVRLNKTQRVMALAELSDGTFWSSSAEVVVTESACLDAE
ncbi:MAG: thiosulfate oxidation carrier protein SoxY [Usitatibacteraceae bacterium]